MDGRVRVLLWRLRARLVVPPDAQRAGEDLDRILAAAGELRQAQPDVHIEAAQDEFDVDTRAVGEPLFGSSKPEPVRLRPVESLAARRESKLPYSVSRVAAVAVLVVGVAGGLAAAMDRDGNTILALLGTDTQAPIDSAEGTGSDADIPDRDAAIDTTDVAAPEDGADRSSNDEVAEEPADDGESNEVSDTDTSPPSSSDQAEENGSEEAETDGGERTREQREEPREQPRETVEEADDTVIAAPDPEDAGELDGFGGPAPCPEDSLRDCASQDEASSEEPPVAEAADEAADEGDADDEADEDAEGDPLKELASRRYRP